MAERRGFSQRLVEMLELPPDIVLDLPKLTLIGDRQVSLENHRGVIEYAPDLVRVSSNRGEIRIRGVDLSIRSIVKEEILLHGRVIGVDLVDWSTGR
ncbi:MAG: sporulation protein YqfC [Patescibacteria group bacterium]